MSIELGVSCGGERVVWVDLTKKERILAWLFNIFPHIFKCFAQAPFLCLCQPPVAHLSVYFSASCLFSCLLTDLLASKPPNQD